MLTFRVELNTSSKFAKWSIFIQNKWMFVQLDELDKLEKSLMDDLYSICSLTSVQKGA